MNPDASVCHLSKVSSSLDPKRNSTVEILHCRIVMNFMANDPHICLVTSNRSPYLGCSSCSRTHMTKLFSRTELELVMPWVDSSEGRRGGLALLKVAEASRFHLVRRALCQLICKDLSFVEEMFLVRMMECISTGYQ